MNRLVISFVVALAGVVLLVGTSPVGASPIYYDNMVLFELRTRDDLGGGAPAADYAGEGFTINNTDLVAPLGVPDDPNVLLLPDTEPAGSINGGPDVYGQGWTTGNTGTVADVFGTCCAANGRVDALIINNTFQIWDDDGLFEFTENIDDRFHITVNGTHIHSDSSWNTRTQAVWNDDDGQGGGWYSIEAYSVEDGGGAGTAGGIGFGFNNAIGTGSWQVIGPGYVGDTNAAGVSYRAELDGVPEPATVTLALIGLVGLCGLAFRRRRARRDSA